MRRTSSWAPACYPAGAYVTLEHEHILIVRKGGKRDSTATDGKQPPARKRHLLGGAQRLVLRCVDGTEGHPPGL